MARAFLSIIVQNCCRGLEATPGFEPGNSGFADRRLTTWLCRLMERKTGFEPATLAMARRCSTVEPLPHVVPRAGFEPARPESQTPKACVSASSTISALHSNYSLHDCRCQYLAIFFALCKKTKFSLLGRPGPPQKSTRKKSLLS